MSRWHPRPPNPVRDRRYMRRHALKSPADGAQHASSLATRQIAIAVSPAITMGLEEELYLLRALRFLKERHQRVRWIYQPGHEALLPMLSPLPWFLSDAEPAVSLTVELPAIADVTAGEEDAYRTAHRAVVEERKAQQMAAFDAGVKDLKIEIPEYSFRRQWHIANALCWSLQQELGLVGAVQQQALAPYGHVPGALRSEIQHQIRRFLDRPFALADFRGLPEQIEMYRAAAAELPGLRIVKREDLDVYTDHPTLAPLVAMQHPHCRWCLSSNRQTLTLAWAADAPAIIQCIMESEDIWSVVRPGDRTFVIPADKLHGEARVRGIAQGVSFVDQVFGQGKR